MLTLSYRLRQETIKILENEKVENLIGKMPKWTNEEVIECFICRSHF